MATNDDDLLKEIKENFDVAVLEWQDIREEGRIDMRYIVDGPWSEKERAARKAADRPCLSYDELGQYTSQAIGDMRQNKRAIKVTPKGDGANDHTAEMRAGMIREVEYKSKAQTAYSIAFENMVKRSYGYFKLGTKRCRLGSFDQELVISAVPNPDTIYLDPFAKEPDWSDMGWGFEIESFAEKEFKKKWPNAQIVSFEGHTLLEAPAWIGPNKIQVGAYWRREDYSRTLLAIDGGPAGPKTIYLDQLPKGTKVHRNEVGIAHPETGELIGFPLLDRCEEKTPVVMQYITNGLEILEKNPTKWKEIPIIPVFGPEEYVDLGGGSKRRLRSMVRRARDAYMSYCYVRTNEVEVIGMVPKMLYLGYEGQFDTNTPWDDVNKIALPYAEVKAQTTATGEQTLPLPQRQLYDPPVQGLEMVAASMRMGIQAAMGGGSGMLNGQMTQDQSAKSGKAIEALDRQEAQGTYEFISNFERSLERCGRMADDALDWVYDTAMEVGTRSPDDQYKPAKINQTDEQGNPVGFQTGTGDHGTTISVGPSEQSQRDAANDFADSLMNIPGIPPKVIGLCVRLRNLGPIGDQIANVFDPTGGQQALPPEVEQHMAQSNDTIAKLTATVHALQNKLDAKIPELESKERMHAQDLDFKREQLAVEASIGAAKIGSAEAIERLNIETDLIAQERGRDAEQAAEAAAQAADQGHEAGLQGATQAHEAQLQAADHQHQAGMQQSAQDAAAESDATGTP